MNLMWSPGMSDSAREVNRHLSGREKAALYALSFLFGICAFAIPIVIMGLVMELDSIPELLEGFAFPLVVCLVAGFWLAIVLQRRILLGSQFAKAKGLTWTDINARQPLSRREYLALGGVAALALAIALATALFAFLMAG